MQNKKPFHFQEKEKQWRQQNLTIARMEAQRNEELRRVRTEQMRQREEIAAISVSYHEFEIRGAIYQNMQFQIMWSTHANVPSAYSDLMPHFKPNLI